jgi:hypothetical protein
MAKDENRCAVDGKRYVVGQAHFMQRGKSSGSNGGEKGMLISV